MYVEISHQEAGVYVLVIWFMNELNRGSHVSVSLSDTHEFGKRPNASITVSRGHGCCHSCSMQAYGVSSLDLGLQCYFALLSFMERSLFTSVWSLKMNFFLSS